VLTVLPSVTSRSAVTKATTTMGGTGVNRARAADDFAAIRAHMEELRREQEAAHAAESELHRDPGINRSRSGARWAIRGQLGARPGPTVWRGTQLG
jgi:hypothetical protein